MTITSTSPTNSPAGARGHAAEPRSLVAGFNHVAVITADLERLAAFYTDTLDAEYVEVPAPPGTRAGTVKLTETAGIVVVEMPANPHVAGSADMLARGHIDHLALEAPPYLLAGSWAVRLGAWEVWWCRYGSLPPVTLMAWGVLSPARPGVLWPLMGTCGLIAGS